MRGITRFILFFVLTYAVCLLVYQLPVVSNSLNSIFKKISIGWVTTCLPSAEISFQEMKNKSKSNSDIYLVYGNPILIQKAKDEAIQSKQVYATIPTKSIELHLFEMFIVPLFFLISLFIATPVNSKTKLKGLGISILFLVAYLLVKLICLSLFEISNNRIGIYELSDAQMSFLIRLLGVLSLGMSISICIFLWFIFGFRKSSFIDDFKLLLGNVKH